MRLSWQMLVAALAIVGIFAILFRELASGKQVDLANPEVRAYLQRLQPVEKELEDVRKNLRGISEGRPVRESTAHISQDAARESTQLQTMDRVPNAYADTHKDLVAWSKMLQTGAAQANNKLDRDSRREIMGELNRADVLYQRIEVRIPSDER